MSPSACILEVSEATRDTRLRLGKETINSFRQQVQPMPLYSRLELTETV